MSGWNPTAPRNVTAKTEPLASDAISFRSSQDGGDLELMFIIRNPGPEPVTLTWGSVSNGVVTLPDPSPSLIVPAPADSEPEIAQFGPFTNRMASWFVTTQGGDQSVVVDVYTRFPAWGR